MSDYDFSALQAAMGVVPIRIEDDSVRRVRLLGGWATKTLANEPASPEEALYVAGAVSTWLRDGGDLVRDHLRIAPPRGSHRTASAIWRGLHRDDAHDVDDADDRDQG